MSAIQDTTDSTYSKKEPLLKKLPSVWHRRQSMTTEQNEAAEWMMESKFWWPGHKQLVKVALDVIARRKEHWKSIKDFEEKIEETQEEIKAKDEPAKHDIEDLVVGPAVKWAWIANIITWSGFLLLTPIVAFEAEIDDYGVSQTIYSKKSPVSGILIVGIWAVTTFIPIYFELKAALCVLPAQLCNIGIPGIIGGYGKGMTSFRVYVIILLSISFGLHADILTSAVFIGRTFKATHSCRPYNQAGACSKDAKCYLKDWSWAWFWYGDDTAPLEIKWRAAASSSAVFRLVGFDRFSFWQLAFISWCFLFCQFLYAVAYAMPTTTDLRNDHYEDLGSKLRSGCCKRYKMVDGESDYIGLDPETGPRRRSLYHTFMAQYTSHGRCLQALADSGRMMSVQWFDDDYVAMASKEWKLSDLITQMQRANVRFFVFALQCICIPNLQISFFGAQKYLSVNSGLDQPYQDWITVTSVVLGVLAGAKYVVWELKSLFKYSKLLPGAFDAYLEKGISSKHCILRKHEIWTRKFKAGRAIVIGALISLICLLQFGYLIIKAVMELALCPQGSWNTPHNPFDFMARAGCVPPPNQTSAFWSGNWSFDVCETPLSR